MRKIVLPALLLGAILTSVVGCKKETTVDANGKEVVVVDDMNEANEIIEFNNNFIQKSEKNRSYIDAIDRYVDRLQNFIDGKSHVAIQPILIESLRNELKAPDALGKNKDEIQTLVDDFSKKFETIKKKTDELVAYVKAEDFKDDNGAKAKTLESELLVLVDEYYATQDKISAVLQPIADGAEVTILKDHPLKDYIINSKKALLLSQTVSNTVGEQFNSEKYDFATIKKQYEDLEKVAKTNSEKEFKVSDTSLKYKKDSYERFNKQIETFLGTMRKVMRDAEKSNAFTENQVDEVFNGYENVISSYNTFVD